MDGGNGRSGMAVPPHDKVLQSPYNRNARSACQRCLTSISQPSIGAISFSFRLAFLREVTNSHRSHSHGLAIPHVRTTAIATWPVVHTVRCTTSTKSTPNTSQNFLLPMLLAHPVQQCSRMLAFGAVQPLQAFN